jgi:hypothetical protein
MKKKTASIYVHWDESGVVPGWYCINFDASDDFVTDSIKIDYPINVDYFYRSQEQELLDALRKEYPDAEIFVCHNCDWVQV